MPKKVFLNFMLFGEIYFLIHIQVSQDALNLLATFFSPIFFVNEQFFTRVIFLEKFFQFLSSGNIIREKIGFFLEVN